MLRKNRLNPWPYSVVVDYGPAPHVPGFPGAVEVDAETAARLEVGGGGAGTFKALFTPDGSRGLETALRNGRGEYLTVGDVFDYQRRLVDWAKAEAGPSRLLIPDAWLDPNFMQFQSEDDMHRFIAKWGGTPRQPTGAERRACNTPEERDADAARLRAAPPVARPAGSLRTIILGGGRVRQPTRH